MPESLMDDGTRLKGFVVNFSSPKATGNDLTRLPFIRIGCAGPTARSGDASSANFERQGE